MKPFFATLTGTEWVAVIGAVGGLVALAQVAIIAVIREWKADVAAKLQVIQGSVDGTATKQAAKLDVALEQLAFMTKQVSEQRQTAAVLAATAPSGTTVVTAPARVGPPVDTGARDRREGDGVLGEIAQNTADTVTAVADLKEHP